MLVWVYTFAQQKLKPLRAARRACGHRLIPSCDLEGLGRIGRHQLVKGGQQELSTVDEAKLPEGEGYVLLCVVGDARDLTTYPRDGLHQ